MIEIRFHGRGGQGAVVATKILATSVFLDGRYSQSFPAFGVERRGAPVTAFLRVDEKPIRIRTEIYEPDHLVVLDPLLVEQVPLANGLKKDGIIIINSNKKPVEFSDMFKGFRVATVPAGKIAVKYHLGSPQSPIVNTAILGAVAKVLGVVTPESLIEGIKTDVPAYTENNAAAAQEAYETVSNVVQL
ncbi:MAG: 2-oxoacid:acceptor oxidoreductase family protein [Deltaproteobacteria bacterium]|nr:2-oxoacid:acceptor oxidoreductase family protein [Deltaproteobacteria bacterium]MBW2339150.1 2-oxoacid:acceptor oxidoreductase family protein [Deltaproteobacteria bacterium]